MLESTIDLTHDIPVGRHSDSELPETDSTPLQVADEPVPSIRVSMESFLLNRGTEFGHSFNEVDVPVIELSFQYGNLKVSASDPQTRILLADDAGLVAMARHEAAENRARYLLESFGAVEVGCVEDYEPPFDSKADYLVRVDGDEHGYCAFAAYGIPQLRALGWQVEIDEDYPYQSVSGDTAWYTDVEPSSFNEEADWFSFELGVEVNGQRIDLLELLIDLLESTPNSTSLSSLIKSTRPVALKVSDRQYVSVPAAKLRTVLGVLRELYEGRKAKSTFQLGNFDLTMLARIEVAFEEQGEPFVWRGNPKLRNFAHSLIQPAEATAMPGAPGLCATLRPYQEHGLAWLQRLRELEVCGILADDMGLGKTLQTIAHIWQERREGRLDLPALIVAPTSLVGNWEREIKRFAPQLKTIVLYGKRRHQLYGKLDSAHVAITSYPLAIRDRDKLTERDFHMLILDEAQTIKNPRSQAHHTVKALSARHRLCLTGTPIENNLEELWSQFDFLMPGFLGRAEDFRLRYRTPIESGEDTERLGPLRARVSPFILRRTKDNVAKELPPKTEIVRPVDLHTEQREYYESIRLAAHSRVRKAIRQKGFARSTITILDALMKLRQVCCDPRLVAADSARKLTRSAKHAVLMEMVEQQLQQGRRILIFSQFTSMLALISDGLQQRGISHLALTGASRHRQQLVDRFESGAADVFLISLKAGGTGLNLTSADTVIHYDPWWNPAAQAQATDRVYRIGQTKPVFVYNLIVAGSVEERMLRLQQKKQHLADCILGTDGQTSVELSEALVEDLLAPLEPGE